MHHNRSHLQSLVLSKPVYVAASLVPSTETASTCSQHFLLLTTDIVHCITFLLTVQDFSDLVAQKAAQQKRKAAQAKETGKNKKQKSDNFKF